MPVGTSSATSKINIPKFSKDFGMDLIEIFSLINLPELLFLEEGLSALGPLDEGLPEAAELGLCRTSLELVGLCKTSAALLGYIIEGW